MKKFFLLSCLLACSTLSCSSYRYSLSHEFNDFFATENSFYVSDIINFYISDNGVHLACHYEDVVNAIKDSFDSISYEKISVDDIPSSFLQSETTHILSSGNIDTKLSWGIYFDSVDIYASFNKVLSGDVIHGEYSNVSFHGTVDIDTGKKIFDSINLTFGLHQL